MSIQRQLFSENAENPTFTKEKFLHLAQEYYSHRLTEDQMAIGYIKNETLKAIFNLLLKLSFGLFGIGIVLTFQSNTITEQKVVIYLQSVRNQIFLIILIFLGVTVLTMLKIIKEDNKITANTKKIQNCIVDNIRAVFYVLALAFVEPFVYENSDNGSLMASFWIFTMAILLFIGRKFAKWAYYLFDKQGKKIYRPWESKDTMSKQNLAKIAQFVDYMVKKHFPESLKPELITPEQMQKIKKIQDQIVRNMKQKGDLMHQLSSLLK